MGAEARELTERSRAGLRVVLHRLVLFAQACEVEQHVLVDQPQAQESRGALFERHSQDAVDDLLHVFMIVYGLTVIICFVSLSRRSQKASSNRPHFRGMYFGPKFFLMPNTLKSKAWNSDRNCTLVQSLNFGLKSEG